MALNISVTHATVSTSTEDCAICLLPLSGHKTFKLHPSLEVFHEFHKSCISSWVSIKNECPLCKRAPALIHDAPSVSAATAHVFDGFGLTEEQEEALEGIYALIEHEDNTGLDHYFSTHPANRLILEKAVEKAAFLGKIESLELLLSKGEISMRKRGLALNSAAQEGHLGAVNLLIDEENIPADILGHALVVATRHERVNVVERIIDHGVVTTTAFARALKEAAFNMNEEILDKLKASDQLTPKEKTKAVKLACRSSIDL